MKKRSLVIILIPIAIVVIILFWPDGKKSDELVYFPNKRPDCLVPILNVNEEAKYLCELIFDGLVNKTIVRDGREHYQWALVAENGYREESPWNCFLITIYLRKGVLWHDGRELTAGDVIYTWKAIRQSNSPLRGWLNSFIEEIRPVEGNPYKIKIKLKVERSREAFMELFSHVKILPRWYTYQGEQRELPLNLNDGSEISEEFKFRPIGTGPYKIKERSIEERVLLEANEIGDYRYYLLDQSATNSGIKSIKMEVEKDPIKAVKELKKDRGLVFDVRQEFFEQLKNAPLNYQNYLPYSFYTIAYNTRKPPFDDPHFRMAVTCATDKEKLAREYIINLDVGNQPIINSGIFPTSSGYVQFSPSSFLETNSFNIKRARQHLETSTVTIRSFHLLISSQYDGKRAMQLAKSYKDMMRAIGIEVEIDDFNAPMYDRRINERHFDAVFYQFTGFDHFYDLRSLFGRGELNYWQVYDSRLEELLDTLGSTLEWEKLVELTQQIHTRVNEITPGCFLFTVPRRAYYSDRLKNVSIHPEVGFSTIERWELR